MSPFNMSIGALLCFCAITISLGCTNASSQVGEHETLEKDKEMNTESTEPTKTNIPADIQSLDLDRIRKEGNHLINERSVYLKQHAHNPIDWYPWKEEALSLARRENKPIFLSIGYSSCHWCHVMEHEVFEHDNVALFMNQHFVSIKVDREERPDLDATYMEAVQAMTGRGGWPMSVFLTPDLKPFYGGTYIPREQFLTLAQQLSDAYAKQPASLFDKVSRLVEQLAARPSFSQGNLDEAIPARAASDALRRIDREWGGFRSRMKFPTPARWRFLLHHYRKTGNDKFSQAIRTTLDQIGSGGINDQLGGGFHRYTTEATWLVPHFEKMLYDNAQLAGLYVEASVVFKDQRYQEIARETLDFMIREMSGDEGEFYASFDADSGGEEGSYYVWTPAEIEEIVGPDEGPALVALLGVTEQGNFEGKNILTRRIDPGELAEKYGRSGTEIAALLAKHRKALLEHRNHRTPPNLDRKIVTSWNGLAIQAMAEAYSALGDERYRRAAISAADYLWKVHHREDGGLYRVSNQGKAENHAVLDDYAFLAVGLLELFQAVHDAKYLSRGLKLVDFVLGRFAIPDGGFYLTEEGQPVPLSRQYEIYDSVRPSGNSAMLLALTQASALTGLPKYKERLEQMLSAHVENYSAAGIDMAGWLDIHEKYTGPYYDVVIAGDPSTAETRELLNSYYKLKPSHAVLSLVPSSGADRTLTSLAPTLKGKRALEGKATAFVCRYGECKEPTSDPKELKSQLLDRWTL